ncbi:MAG: sporulation integral membrane protein YtvI [Ruminococcaceae bacterium]|nr:sporulation integral membrane protein YtvI [Oscillospiraceae bacterium]
MDTEYRKAANITVIVAGIAIFLWIFFKYALSALMPFLLAAVISALVSPMAKRLSKKTKIPQKISAGVILILIFALTVSLLYFAISRLILELGDLLARLSENPEMIGNKVQGIVDKLTANGTHFSFLQKIFESEALKSLGIDINSALRDALGSMISSLTGALPSAAVSLVKEIPNVLLFIIVFLIAAFYFSADAVSISDALSEILPSKWLEKIPVIKEKFKKTVTGYLKAYFFIMLLTFFEMLIGLTLLGVEYAFIMAIIISVVDILPILGTGAVLVPWAIFAFMSSNTPLGVGLLILYAVTLVVRQLAEPKIVGSTLGIHPLATLASVYLGLKFLGFVGIFVGPMVALLMRELFFKKSDEKDEKNNDKKNEKAFAALEKK